MRIIISPAKKMVTDTDSFEVSGLPCFLDKTRLLLAELQKQSPAALQKLWACNDQIAQLNIERLQKMQLERGLTPAILSYEGIQYQYMAPDVFTGPQLEYIGEHLRILSGFYGVLTPFDGVTPYRLEMQARLAVNGAKDLYAFWGDSLAKKLAGETDCILNLASKEYSMAVSRHLPQSCQFITCVFGERKGEKIIEKGTMCKMARGEMVRFMAENNIKNPQQVQKFDRLGYRYSPEKSNENTYVFIKQTEDKN